MKKAYDTNWMSTVRENISKLESLARAHMEGRHAVALRMWFLLCDETALNILK